MGLPPMLGLLRSNHFDVQDNRGGWADVATFLTQRHRVVATMTDVMVKNTGESSHWWSLDRPPAEVVLESRVTSPAVAARWGIHEPLTVREKEGGVAPLHLFDQSGVHEPVSVLLFDGMVLPEEVELRLDLHAEEIEYDWRYGVYETLRRPFYDDLGAGAIMISTKTPGSYTFDAPGWSCGVSVLTYDYPFAASAIAAVEPPAPRRLALSITPDPHIGPVRIELAGLVPAQGAERATLDVLDVSGRLVRSIEGDARGGIVWDGRGESGLPMPAGVYLYRLTTPHGAWSGRSVMVR
jgi:hypothetical protein